MGRHLELARLSVLLGQARPVVVTGEPGVGKTTLLRAAADAFGSSVHEGGALSMLSWVPYLPLRRAVGREFPEAADPAFVAREVEAAVGTGALILDDLHWADSGTLRVAGLLAGRVPLLAAVRRGEPDAEAWRAELAAAEFEEIGLMPLEPEAAAELVRVRRPELGAPLRERLVRRSGGNPLILTELLFGGGEPPESLRLALRARISALGPTERAAFELLVLAGRPLPAQALDPAAVTALDEAGLVQGGATGVEVRHALIAEEARAMLGEERARSLHARLARLADDSGTAARHHAEAGEPELACLRALEAAEASADPFEVAGHLAVAARYTSGPEGEQMRLDAARGLAAAGEWSRIGAVLGDLNPDDPARAADFHLMRARAAWSAGDVETFAAELRTALDLGGAAGGDAEVRVRIEAIREIAFLRSADDEAVEAARAALASALERGVEEARARYMLGTILYLTYRSGWDRELEIARRLARESGELETELLSANNLVTAHESAGDPTVGARIAAEMRERCAELHAAAWEQQFRALLLNLAMHAGDYERVVRESIELLGEPLEHRTREQLEHTICLASIDLGRFDVAESRLGSSGPSSAEDWQSGGNAMFLRCELDLMAGRPKSVLERLSTAPVELQASAIGPLLAIVQGWAAYDVGAQVTLSRAGPRPFGGACAGEIDALDLLLAGRYEAAAAAFAAAAELYAPYHRRGELRSAWGAAEALRRAGQAVDAIARLEDLEQRLTKHAMQPMLRRTHQALRALGIRRAAPQVRTSHGLTEREEEMVRLVAQGLTDAEIARRLRISPATVKTTLRSALARLRVESRGQAVLALGS